jgi:hypothetical protein
VNFTALSLIQRGLCEKNSTHAPAGYSRSPIPTTPEVSNCSVPSYVRSVVYLDTAASTSEPSITP